jgi:serine/threonine-protein kinase
VPAVPRSAQQDGSAPKRFPPQPSASQVIPGKSADPKLIEGSRIGNYEVIRKIGQGGMGVVYEGRHLLLPRRVAIKFLLTNQSHDEEQIRRFLGEAVASAQIGHKGVVDIYDYGYDENKTAYLIMEFVDGQSLQAIMKRSGQLPIPMVVRVVRDIAEVLAAAHQSGIIHRDLKPDNIILSRDEFGKDFVKILDFGVAKFVNAQGMSGQTIAGSILGTPWYMPPEQCQGLSEVNFRSDIYALGCVCYQMLCGKVPFAGSLRDVLTAHIHSEPAPPTQFNPGVPPALAALLARMMAKDPNHRPASMDEVAAALQHLTEPDALPHAPSSATPMPQSAGGSMGAMPTPRSWVAPVVAALIACAGTAAAFYFLQG